MRFAFRTLARSPWFAALAIVTLAIGIGATTALFTLVDAVLLRALPFKDPDRLVEIWGQDDTRSGMRVPGPILEALRAKSATLESVAIHGPISGVMPTPDGAVDVRGDRVSANFVEVMGVPPLAGRGFLPEDDRPGAAAAIVVSFGFWQRHLGGDPAALGRTVYLDKLPYTLVGIMPPAFRTSFAGITKDFWTPHVSDRVREIERDLGYELIARLSPGVSLEDAQRETYAVAAGVDVQGWGSSTPPRNKTRGGDPGTGGRRLGMVRLKDEVVRDSAYALQLLMAAVAVVLAIVCANLAQLLLARADRRVREFATRKAIGAGALQLFRLPLVESLLLSAAGGAAGIVLAYWLVPAMLALAPSEIPRLAEAAIDARVLAVAVGLSVLTGCAFGLAPALRLSRLSVVQAMKRTPGSDVPRRARVRSGLVVIQVAASVTLFALAGLVGQTFLALLPSNPGFEAHSRTVFMLSIPPRLFPSPLDRLLRLEDMVRRLEALPGVTAASFADDVPFSGDDGESLVRRADETSAVDDASLQAHVTAISPSFFEILQMPLVQGRIFSVDDRGDAPRVAIVNQRLARRLASGGAVLGTTIRVGSAAASPGYRIVGVIADARSTATSADVLNQIYVPYAQSRTIFAYMIVRSAPASGSLTDAIRREVHAAVPELPLRTDQRATALDDLVRQSLAGPRFSATLIGAFSAVALLLAGIGLFGLVAYSVSERQQELGIRAALGARPRDLIVTMIRSALRLTAVGIVVGLLAGAYLTRFVESQLHAIDSLDVPTFAAAAVAMLAVAGLAAYVPARRAVRTDPMTALRDE